MAIVKSYKRKIWNWCGIELKVYVVKVGNDVVPFAIKLESASLLVIQMNYGSCKWCWCRLWFFFCINLMIDIASREMMTIFICAKNNMITLSPNRQVKRRREEWILLFDNYENKYLVEIIFAVRDLWGKIWTYAVKWWNLIGFIMFEGSHGFARVWPRNWYAMRCDVSLSVLDDAVVCAVHSHYKFSRHFVYIK